MPKHAALVFSLAAVQAGALPSWIQLLPAGEAKPVDGRDAWQVDPDAVVAASASKLPGLIDADHGMDLLPKGSQIPAYGWIEELAAKGPAGEPGVWGRVEWTDLGQKALAGRSYRYISPVFYHDPNTRDVRRVERASLTNDPALQLKALASRERENPPENHMSFAKIAVALGLAATVSEDAILAAITKNQGDAVALASRLKTVAEAGGITGDIGDDHVVALAAKLKAPPAADDDKFVSIEKFDALQKQLASVMTANAVKGAEAAVDAAILSGRLAPVQRDWAIGLASKDRASFDEMVKVSPQILPSGQIVQPGETAADGELTAAQKQICANTGVSEDAFKKQLAANKGAA